MKRCLLLLQGFMTMAKLTFDGKPMPAGRYTSTHSSRAITGNGTLVVR